jgi:hypothetical protein
MDTAMFIKIEQICFQLQNSYFYSHKLIFSINMSAFPFIGTAFLFRFSAYLFKLKLNITTVAYCLYLTSHLLLQYSSWGFITAYQVGCDSDIVPKH